MAKTNKKASKKDVTFMYNKTEDILVVGKHKKYRKVKASIDMGEVLLDVSTRGSKWDYTSIRRHLHIQHISQLIRRPCWHSKVYNWLFATYS